MRMTLSLLGSEGKFSKNVRIFVWAPNVTESPDTIWISTFKPHSLTDINAIVAGFVLNDQVPYLDSPHLCSRHHRDDWMENP